MTNKILRIGCRAALACLLMSHLDVGQDGCPPQAAVRCFSYVKWEELDQDPTSPPDLVFCSEDHLSIKLPAKGQMVIGCLWHILFESLETIMHSFPAVTKYLSEWGEKKGCRTWFYPLGLDCRNFSMVSCEWQVVVRGWGTLMFSISWWL